jgi:hypothetical protein
MKVSHMSKCVLIFREKVFRSGIAKSKSYAIVILKEVTKFLSQVVISIYTHTVAQILANKVSAVLNYISFIMSEVEHLFCA